MRFKSPLIAISAVGMLALSACGGSGSVERRRRTDRNQNEQPAATPVTVRTPTAKGPVTIAGATEGRHRHGAHPDRSDHDDRPERVYYTDTSSILSGLVDAVADAVQVRPDDQADDPGPRPGHRPRSRHNDNYTQWKFTIRPGVKWENGKPVTAKDVAFGMTRCMDAATFPTGACQYYSNAYFKGGVDLQGPVHRPRARSSRASRSTATPSPSRWPSRSRTCRTGARSRPTARSRRARSRTRRPTRTTRGRPVRT